MTRNLAITDPSNPTQATQTLPPSSSSIVLDDGCGLGTVTAEVKKSFPDLSVLAIDSSAGMLEAVERKAKKHDWKNVETKLLDGGDLNGMYLHTSSSFSPYIAFRPAVHRPQCITDAYAQAHHFPRPARLNANAEPTKGVSSATISHAFACTYIDLAHNGSACIQELSRVIAPGGVLALNTWADPIHPSISTPWTKACRQVYPDFKPPTVTSPKWSTPELIKENLEKAGFKDVQTKQVMTHWRWASPDEMTEWFFNGGNPVCKRWHEALVDEVGGEMAGMRERFHEELELEYKNEGGQFLKEELVNLTIARK